MLPVDFAGSKASHPNLTPILTSLEKWVRANPSLPYIDVLRFRMAFPRIGLGEVLAALTILEEDGILNRAFAVQAPTNYALALDPNGEKTAVFASEEEIPEELFDTTATPFPSDEGELVPVYVGAEGD